MQQPMLPDHLLQTVGTYVEPGLLSTFRNLNAHHRNVLLPTLAKVLVQTTSGLKPLLQIAGVGNEHVIAEVAA